MQATTTERPTAADIGLIIENERDFYHQHAQPMMERHALLATAENAEELRPAMEAEWALLAEYGLDFFRFRLQKVLGLPYILETPELLADIEAYLRGRYSPAECDPQAVPRGGDGVRSVPEWGWGRTGDKVGIFGGAEGYTAEDNTPGRFDGASVCFNTEPFRGKSSKFGTGPVYTSCSGGPATIWTAGDGMTWSGAGIVKRVWRWKDSRCAGGGLSYQIALPVWLGDLNQ